MKKRLIIISLIIIAMLSILTYRYFNPSDFEHLAGLKSEERKVIMNNLSYVLCEEKIYENIEDDFIISSLEEYSDKSEIIDTIKDETIKKLDELKSENESTKIINLDECEYYIEIKDKQIEKLIFSKYKHLTLVSSWPTYSHKNIRDFSKTVEEAYQIYQDNNSLDK